MSITASRLLDVLAFIEQEVPRPRPREIGPDTDLRSDLRMHWEDAETLLDRFFSKFEVDRIDFHFDRYFPPERFSLFGRSSPTAPSRLTLRKMADAASAGSWPADEDKT